MRRHRPATPLRIQALCLPQLFWRPPPGAQCLAGQVLADRPLLHAQVHEEAVGLADDRPGGHAELGHDLAAVEVGADGGQLLGGAQGLDTLLEVVVGAVQHGGLAAVAGGDVGPGEPVEALQQGTGVGGVAAHGRVRPGGVDVAVEAQVELDQPRDVLDGLLVEAQRPQTLGRHPGTDVVVAVEGDGAVGQEAAGGGLADVVEDGGQAQHQVGAGDGPSGPVSRSMAWSRTVRVCS